MTDSAEVAFRAAVAYLIDVLEGGGRLITDQGGLTRWGISQRAYPTEAIARMSRQRAEDLYRRDYWNAIKGDLLPAPVALLVFVAAVNLGPRTAIRILQRVLGVDDDGVVGTQTLVAAQGYRPQYELRARFTELVLRYYQQLAQSDQAKHGGSLHGWWLRALRVADESGRWAAGVLA